MAVTNQYRLATRELTTRSYAVRATPESVNLKDRTVESVMATEDPVLVMDFERYEPIAEILLMSGVELPESRQVPLLDSHSRFSISDVFGSARDLRIENNQLIGRNHFADDQRSNDAFSKVAAGHVRDNSIGYTVRAFQDLEPGESRTIGDREFTADANLRMRITTNWVLRENSITPIGADPGAKMRAQEVPTVSEKEKARQDAAKIAAETERAVAPTIQPATAQKVVELDEERDARKALAKRSLVMSICPKGLESVAERCLIADETMEATRSALLAAHTETVKPIGTPEPVIESTDDAATELPDDDVLLRSILG